MTREEAIKTLKEHKIMFQHDFGWDISTIKALDIAISDLSTDGEYIKKEDLFNKTIKRNSIWNKITNAEGKGLEEIVNDLPTYSFSNSAENKGEWIPVSERLPEEEQEVLCQLSDDSCAVLYVQDNWGQMDWVDGQMGTGTYDVIAWKPLPDPYQKGGE